MPEPQPAIAAFADAVERGDVDVLYDMMSAESRRALSRDELRRVLAEQRDELREHARHLGSPDCGVSAQARVRFADGDVATLDLVEGQFRVTAADALPATARTPVEALTQLRRVLTRRSYPGLLRVLTPRTRSATERELRSLLEGLAEPEALPIEITGDEATVDVPGGHRIELRREDGIWHVDDVD